MATRQQEELSRARSEAKRNRAAAADLRKQLKAEKAHGIHSDRMSMLRLQIGINERVRVAQEFDEHAKKVRAEMGGAA